VSAPMSLTRRSFRIHQVAQRECRTLPHRHSHAECRMLRTPYGRSNAAAALFTFFSPRMLRSKDFFFRQRPTNVAN
jgi:hypothetical protein